MTIFVDCDGVLADFDQHVQNRFGYHPNDLTVTNLWNAINNDGSFYLHLPLKSDAGALWYALSKQNPVVLTGCTRSNFEHASKQKKIWISWHFGPHVEVITCLARDKHTYLRSHGDILIDDRRTNIKRWNAAGGRGILHKNTATTLSELTSYVGQNTE